MVFPLQIVLKVYNIFGTTSLDTNDVSDQTVKFKLKVKLTLNNVGGLRNTGPHVVENLHRTFDSPPQI